MSFCTLSRSVGHEDGAVFFNFNGLLKAFVKSIVHSATRYALAYVSFFQPSSDDDDADLKVPDSGLFDELRLERERYVFVAGCSFSSFRLCLP